MAEACRTPPNHRSPRGQSPSMARQPPPVVPLAGLRLHVTGRRRQATRDEIGGYAGIVLALCIACDRAPSPSLHLKKAGGRRRPRSAGVDVRVFSSCVGGDMRKMVMFVWVLAASALSSAQAFAQTKQEKPKETGDAGIPQCPYVCTANGDGGSSCTKSC